MSCYWILSGLWYIISQWFVFITYRQQRALEESSLARTVNTGEQREAMRTREAVDAAPEIAAPVSKRQTRHRATHKVRKPRRPASSVKEVMRQISLVHIIFLQFHSVDMFYKSTSSILLLPCISSTSNMSTICFSVFVFSFWFSSAERTSFLSTRELFQFFCTISIPALFWYMVASSKKSFFENLSIYTYIYFSTRECWTEVLRKCETYSPVFMMMDGRKYLNLVPRESL